jgi:hypothetical protein
MLSSLKEYRCSESSPPPTYADGLLRPPLVRRKYDQVSRAGKSRYGTHLHDAPALNLQQTTAMASLSALIALRLSAFPLKTTPQGKSAVTAQSVSQKMSSSRSWIEPATQRTPPSAMLLLRSLRPVSGVRSSYPQSIQVGCTGHLDRDVAIASSQRSVGGDTEGC